MKVTVYLPDELGKKAKKANLNFSGCLQSALTDELRRRAAAADLEVCEHELELVNDNGDEYVGLLSGTLLSEGEKLDVYLTNDNRVIVVDTYEGKHWECEADELEEALPEDEYIEVMEQLGETARIRI